MTWPDFWDNDKVLRHGMAEILENQRIIMADLSSLTAAMTTLQTNVASLIADTTSQSAVDALTAEAVSMNAAITAVLPATPTAQVKPA
jgi:hypothetical protein